MTQIDEEDLSFYMMELELLIQEAVKIGFEFKEGTDLVCAELSCTQCCNIFTKNQNVQYIDHTVC